MLDSEGFNDENADKQLLFIMNQYGDLKSKVAAIREYNNLKARIRKPGESPDNPVYVTFDPSFNKKSESSQQTKGNSKESS